MPDNDSQSLWDVGRTLVWPMLCRFFPETAIGDAYDRMSTPVAHARHGAPQPGAFVDYLAGPSNIVVTSLSEIETFLRGCTYVTSPTRDANWTTLASHFEVERSGNCLDHSLWAWRKLRELGQPAELVVGVVDTNQVPLMRHAWVVFQQQQQRVRIETIVKEAELPMVQQIRPQADEYWPEIGVSRDGEPFVYAGMVRFHDVETTFPWEAST